MPNIRTWMVWLVIMYNKDILTRSGNFTLNIHSGISIIEIDK